MAVVPAFAVAVAVAVAAVAVVVIATLVVAVTAHPGTATPMRKNFTAMAASSRLFRRLATMTRTAAAANAVGVCTTAVLAIPTVMMKNFIQTMMTSTMTKMITTMTTATMRTLFRRPISTRKTQRVGAAAAAAAH